jgi:hypothetical protein
MESIRYGFRVDGWLLSQALLIWATDEIETPQNVIIDGEHRWKCALDVGLREGPMVRLYGLTSNEAKALTVKLNQKRGDWAEDDLARVLAELSTDDDVLAVDLGFTQEAIDSLVAIGHESLAELATEPPPPGELINDESTADSEPITKLGDVWLLDEHRLVCGDSTSATVVAVALDGAEPKLWVCDPPYDLNFDDWALPPSVDVVAVWHRGKNAYLWMAKAFADPTWNVHELVFTGGVRGHINAALPCCLHDSVSMWRRQWWTTADEAIDATTIRRIGCARTPDNRPHSWHEHVGGVLTGKNSWGKPVLENEIVIAYVPRGAVVWDPCAGTGSSLLAAEQHDRVWRGVELQPRWCDLAIQRWQNVTGKKARLLNR